MFPCVFDVCVTAEKQFVHIQRLTAMFDKSVVVECENAEIHNSLATMAAATTTSSVDSQIEIFVQEVLVKKICFLLFCQRPMQTAYWEFK